MCFGYVGQTVDEFPGLGETSLGLFGEDLHIACEALHIARQQFHGLRQRFVLVRQPFDPFVDRHVGSRWWIILRRRWFIWLF